MTSCIPSIERLPERQSETATCQLSVFCPDHEHPQHPFFVCSFYLAIINKGQSSPPIHLPNDFKTFVKQLWSQFSVTGTVHIDIQAILLRLFNLLLSAIPDSAPNVFSIVQSYQIIKVRLEMVPGCSEHVTI